MVRFREDAKRKESQELAAIEKRAVAAMKFYQGANKLSNDAMFALVDGDDKDEKISEAEWLAFFKKCDTAPSAEGEKEGDADGEQATKGEAAKEEEGLPSETDLSRLFAFLDEEKQGFLSKEKFITLIRVFMKLVKDTVITSGISIKESKTLRRLEVGEVVEILEGPVKEDKVEVMRVHAKVMKDNIEGWITLRGNQGSTFLEEGGNIFKVVKETILTDEFELEGGQAKDAARKLKDTTRKLKEGEIVEVREWAKKEEKSGLMRMKCKVKSDGQVGWVTTVGNQGTVYVELV